MLVEVTYQLHDPANLIRGELCRKLCGCRNHSERYGAEKMLGVSRNRALMVWSCKPYPSLMQETKQDIDVSYSFISRLSFRLF